MREVRAARHADQTDSAETDMAETEGATDTTMAASVCEGENGDGGGYCRMCRVGMEGLAVRMATAAE